MTATLPKDAKERLITQQQRFLCFPAHRQVFCTDALAWLSQNQAAPRTSVITSLPDVSEVPPHRLETWRIWFMETVQRLINWLPADGLAIFYQSDVRHNGVWIDKSYLVQRAAEQTNAVLIWHKIVCRRPPGTISPGRPSYSHMLCIAPQTAPAVQRPGPDVIDDAGFMPWSRAMGMKACQVACRFLRDESATQTIVNPFCGEGSALAIANSFGFAAIGIDLSRRRCAAASQQIPRLDG